MKVAPPSEEQQVPEEQAETAEEHGEGSPFPIVGVGASAGGLEASTELLRELPTDTGMAFVFVHHLSSEHESVLVDILARATEMPVRLAQDGLRVEPNHVYVIPPSTFLAIFHGTLNLMPPEEQPRGTRMVIDYFLRSLAEDQRAQAIGVVLSGTGSDGALGVRGIKAEDGITIAQDPESAAYDGMPRAAIGTGAVDVVQSAAGIASELVRISQHPYLKTRKLLTPSQKLPREKEQELLDKVFIVLRNRVGVDFTYYKPTTVKRRIGRRMAVHRFERLDEYVEYLEDHPDEVEMLYQDLLINVTGFFREPDSFEALKAEVFPKLIAGRSKLDPIRVWVPACSTGEEAYSLAIALSEYVSTQSIKPRVQVFATDISDTSIEKARQAVYPENITAEISPERLDAFFTKVSGGYQVRKSIREAVVFAKHDVTRDPPFSRLDLISCRNLLIYLGQVLQRRLIPVFHYALKPDGFLFLGSSESVGDHTDLFTMLDPKYKIYAKKPVSARPPIEFGFRRYPIEPMPEQPTRDLRPTRSTESVQREADRLSSELFVPPGVLVDSDGQIMQFKGDTSPFLRHLPGQATLDLYEMARPGLSGSLRTCIEQAREEGRLTRTEGVQVRQNGDYRRVDIEVVPLAAEDSRHYLVFFREPSRRQSPEPDGEGAVAESPEAEELRREVERMRTQLRQTTEEKDAALEAQRAANEEIQSSNEELQSINEELETAKEELQSTNEELTTLNEELQNRNFELLSTNDDLRNVLASVQIPIIIVSKDLRIRRYTPMAEKVLNLIPTDVGRPISDLKPKFDTPEMVPLIREVIQDLGVREREVSDERGHWYRLHVRPYRTTEDRIEGAVIALIDIDELKLAQAALEQTVAELEDSQRYSQSVLDTMHELFVVLHRDFTIARASKAFIETFELTPQVLENMSLFDVGEKRLMSEDLRKLVERALEVGEVEEAEVGVEIPSRGATRWVLNVRRLDLKGQESLLLVAATEPR